MRMREAARGAPVLVAAVLCLGWIGHWSLWQDGATWTHHAALAGERKVTLPSPLRPRRRRRTSAALPGCSPCAYQALNENEGVQTCTSARFESS